MRAKELSKVISNNIVQLKYNLEVKIMLTSLMRTNGWLPTVFEDFFNNDFMPRVNTTAPAVNVKEDESYIKNMVIPSRCSYLFYTQNV